MPEPIASVLTGLNLNASFGAFFSFALEKPEREAAASRGRAARIATRQALPSRIDGGRESRVDRELDSRQFSVPSIPSDFSEGGPSDTDGHAKNSRGRI
jgi:hypothetical protein